MTSLRNSVEQAKEAEALGDLGVPLTNGNLNDISVLLRNLPILQLYKNIIKPCRNAINFVRLYRA